MTVRPSGCRKSRGYYALCQSDPLIESDQDAKGASTHRDADYESGYPYYYSCQCPQGYGYENCTLPTGGADDADGSAGSTYCVTEDYTRMEAPTIVEEVFIVNEPFGVVYAMIHMTV